MLYNYIRVFDGDNGTLSDFSLDNQNESTTLPIDFVTGEDYLYVGQNFAFNNLYFQVNSANAVSANMTVEYWGGSTQGWTSVTDLLDGTSSGGASLAQTGVLQFEPNEDYTWTEVSDTTDSESPSELSTITLHNMYWVRVGFSATLTPTTALDRLIYAFTTTQQLDNIDTEINSFQDSFESGKTDWNDEIVTASMQVINDMKRRKIIKNRGQILRLDDLSMATDYRTLMLIYFNLGSAYNDKRLAAKSEYENILDKGLFSLDVSGDGRLQIGETYVRQGSLSR